MDQRKTVKRMAGVLLLAGLALYSPAPQATAVPSHETDYSWFEHQAQHPPGACAGRGVWMELHESSGGRPWTSTEEFCCTLDSRPRGQCPRPQPAHD